MSGQPGGVTTAQVVDSSAFNVGATEAPNRFHTHAPWSDKRIYWDYGDFAAGRIDTDYTAYLDKWTHVVLVSAGNGGAYKAIWLDGVEVATSNTSDGPDIALSGLDIGGWASLGHPGLVDDFRIYDYVLTPAQITALATPATVPATPSGLAATPGLDTMQLDWGAVAGALSYNLGWSLTSGGPYTWVSVATNTYTFTGLSNGTTYYYVVNAANNAGTSADSSQISAQTLTPPPPPPRTYKLGERHMCGWSSVGEADPWGLLLLALAAVALYRTRPRANLR